MLCSLYTTVTVINEMLCKDTMSKQGMLAVGPREDEWLRASVDEAVTFSTQPVWTGEEERRTQY